MAKVYRLKDQTTGEYETVENMLKKFKKQVLNDNTLWICKQHEFFRSKPEKRRIKQEEALKRRKRAQSKNRKKYLQNSR